MKTRSGFVSNSSSSSFICILGVVKSKKDILKHLGEHLDVCSYREESIQFMTIENAKKFWELKVENNKVIIEAFTNQKIEIDINGLSDSDYVFYYDACQGDDHDFFDEYTGSYNYDIDVNFFDGFSKKIFDIIVSNKNGFGEIQKMFGAGRNG